MNRSEAEQLVALAGTFEAFADDAGMVRRLADGLRSYVRSRVSASAPSGSGALQESLFVAPTDSGAALHSSGADSATSDQDVRPVESGSGVTPSSSSDLKLNRKKKTERVRPCTDDPLPDDCRAVYVSVIAERCVTLPSAEYLWSKFVEWLWAEEKSFARWWNLKRRWRFWIESEKPTTELAATATDVAAPARRRVERVPPPSPDASPRSSDMPPAPELVAAMATLGNALRQRAMECGRPPVARTHEAQAPPVRAPGAA